MGTKFKLVATRCHILRLKCTKFDFGWAPLQTLLGELTAGRKEEEGEGKGRGKGMGRGEGREGGRLRHGFWGMDAPAADLVLAGAKNKQKK